MYKIKNTSLLVILALLLCGCKNINEFKINKEVSHKDKYAIYELDLTTQNIESIYTSPYKISIIRMNNQGDELVFDNKIDGNTDQHTEICRIGTDGTRFKQITYNKYWDVYPTWSSDGERIAFISFRNQDFDIYMIDVDGKNEKLVYDSGSHDADIHWAGNIIVFTSHSKIWTINDDGTNLKQITDSENAGQWGQANLPVGDYDPRFSPDTSKIVFERLEDAVNPHGGYNLFVINSDGIGETRLTSNSYSQGIASWSNAGDKIIYTLGAIGEIGMYDIWMINMDGTENTDITPSYFPDALLCHSPIFSKDDSKIYFIGEWWPE